MHNNSNGGKNFVAESNPGKETRPQQDRNAVEGAKSGEPASEEMDQRESERDEREISEKEEQEASEAAEDSTEVPEPNSTVEMLLDTAEDNDDGEESVKPIDAPDDDEAMKDEQAEEDQPPEPKDDDADAVLLEEFIEEEVTEEQQTEAAPRKERTKVELDLCRVCMGAENLSDIFQLEGPVRISDIIMKVCTTIRITERDHLPHKICERCLGQVRIVNEFKARCEASDKELRKNLKRSANKTRPTGVIVVNCPMSESDNEDEPIDDDEYQVSQSEVESEPVTSDDSFSPPNKRKRTPKKRGRKPAQYKTPGRRGRPGRKPKHMAISPVVVTTPIKRGPGRPPKNPKTSTLSNVVYIKAPVDSSSESEEEEIAKARRRRGEHPCPKCDDVLPSQLALKQHLKSHPGDVFNCERCTLWFKKQQTLLNHIERHKKADRKQEEKRREREQRQEHKELYRRSEVDGRPGNPQFTSVSPEKKKKPDPAPASSGRDLFKCVAPLTSTYWSDSFSD
ncbi:FK506-binding protein 5 [Anopheles bellator]|uniref:FK506-binding protein 5 n=1 Tax=Anopheles bellator TaxID=139047 RepID=UPI0026474E20|nr:FK506-binding protein 5 [Anopheles bellator]